MNTSCDATWKITQFKYPDPLQGGADGGGQASVDANALAMREARAREIGFHEGEAAARSHAEEARRRERERINQALAAFEQERRAYFHKVEGEVVQLAMAIARKILHRESQIDPLLLAGLVRVSLEKVGETTAVKLRVNPAQVPAWQAQSGFNATLAVEGDLDLGADECVLETELGSARLSVADQLKEIEQGFFDLLAQRPGAELP